ncbi:MAG: diacylglycerol kinase family protein [Microgenomates group bacterium]
MTKNQNWWQSFKNALNGIVYAFKTQRNFKVHLIISLLVLFFSWWLKISGEKLLFLILAIFLGLTIEMTNTAFEKTLDVISEKYDPKIKIAKDISAGMMLVLSFGLAILGFFIFLPAFIEKIK